MSMYRVTATFYHKDGRKKPAIMKAIVLAVNEEEAISKYRATRGPLDGWYVQARKTDTDVYTY